MPAVVAAVLLLMLPAAARAGTYDVLSCNAPGAGGVNRSWTVEPYNSAGRGAPQLSAFSIPADVEKCDTIYGLTIGSVAATQRVRADDGLAWTFHAPPGTKVKSLVLWRLGNARVSTDDANTPENEGDWWTIIARAGTSAGGASKIGDICPGTTPGTVYPSFCTVGISGYQPGSAVGFAADEPVVSWGIECTGVSSALCFTGDGTGNHAGAQFQGARVTIEDLVAPEVSTDAGRAWRGTGTPVTATATDIAGVHVLRVLVDGAARATETFNCDFRLPAPCQTPATTTLDFAGVADGRHALTVIAEDAAGNVAKSEQAIDLDGTAPALELLPVSGRTIRATASDPASGLRGGLIEVRSSPSKPFTALKTTIRDGRMTATVPRGKRASSMGIRLSASDNAGNFAAQLASSMSLGVRADARTRKVRGGKASVPYGKPASVTGRLTTTDGAALAGQALTVTSRLRRTGAAPEPFATATTDSTGRFTIPVPAGPSRNLVVSYGGTGELLHRVRGASLRVPASSTIHATDLLVSGASAVRFSGRLGALGAGLPAGGKIVDLQASQHGRWTTVATTRATASGWRAVARFRGTPGRYPVRLRIRREAAFPYDLGYSPAVVVRVR